MTKDFAPKTDIKIQRLKIGDKSRKHLKVTFLNETLIKEEIRNIIVYLLEFLRFLKKHLYSVV